MDRNNWALCPFQYIFPQVSFLVFPSTHRVALIATSYWERSNRKMFRETSELVPYSYDGNSQESSRPVCIEISPALWCFPAFTACLVGHWICVPRRLLLAQTPHREQCPWSVIKNVLDMLWHQEGRLVMLIAGSTVLPWMFTAPVHFVLILREGGLDLLFLFLFFRSLPKGCMRAVRGGLWGRWLFHPCSFWWAFWLFCFGLGFFVV